MQKRDRIMQNLVEADAEVGELDQETFPKNGRYRSVAAKCKVITFLRILGASWTKISELLGMNRRDLYDFRMKYEDELGEMHKAALGGGQGLQQFTFSLLREVRKGNDFALKVYAHVSGLWKDKQEHEHRGTIAVTMANDEHIEKLLNGVRD